eukprot:CAMPEP_0183758206 /NCGR_PEP_ID=MMETSP0739-20130205/6266_1 /TAXON_ID=385413 /ORGANISM="Thalassiosira miniscula, Strain CCMP1093" /LENGTH=395 /DNA_ID=CAMNT_0025995769 /DNA_START=30 /DNA_END=1217 /DNA_ORIENTATION=+
MMNFSNALSVLAAGAIASTQLEHVAAHITTEELKNTNTNNQPGEAHEIDERHPSFSGIKKRYVPEDPSITAVEADVGVLPRRNLQAPTCAAGFVECDGGFAVYAGVTSSTTCQTACAGQCCDTANSCTAFTGKVCKDGSSCIGDNACMSATIDVIAQGGCNGSHACFHAEFDRVQNSCRGKFACRWSHMHNTIANSCHGHVCCRNAARNSGMVGDMTDSCHGSYSCYEFATWSNVGTINDSCIGAYSCHGAAQGYGDAATIENMSGSCKGLDTCMNMAAYGGHIGNITDSCNGKRSCYGISADASAGGANLYKACSGERACSNFGRGRGKGQGKGKNKKEKGVTFTGDINNSCNSRKGCFHAFKQENVTRPLNNCCNSEEECKDLKNQPLQCAEV